MSGDLNDLITQQRSQLKIFVLFIQCGDHNNIRKPCCCISGLLTVIITDDQNIYDVVITLVIALREFNLLEGIVLILIDRA